MASGPTMTAPICLVENNNMQLSVNQTAVQILEDISQPVVVVAIVGLYRTGKSYLMNRLAGQNRGECRTQSGAISQIFSFLPWSCERRTKLLSINQPSNSNFHHYITLTVICYHTVLLLLRKISPTNAQDPTFFNLIK